MEGSELQNELQPSAEVRAAVSQLWEHVRAVTDVLAAVSRERDALTSRLQAVEEQQDTENAREAELASLRTQLALAEERYNTASRMLESVHEAAEDAEQFDSLQHSLNELSVDNDSLLQLLQETDAAAENAKSAVSSKVAVSEAEIESLKRSVSEKDITIAELEEQLQSAEARINELSVQSGEAESGALQAAKSELRENALTIENLERQLRVLRMQGHSGAEVQSAPQSVGTDSQPASGSEVGNEELRADILAALEIVEQMLNVEASGVDDGRNS